MRFGSKISSPKMPQFATNGIFEESEKRKDNSTRFSGNRVSWPD